MQLGSNDYLATTEVSNPDHNFLYINQLPNRRIGSLNLYACLTGKPRDEVGDSVTLEFLSYHSSIQQVVAPDAEIKAEISSDGERMTIPFYFPTYLDQSHYHEVTDEEFQNISNDKSRYNATLEVLVYECTGFRCFTRNGSYDIFEDDVVYGECYVRTPEIEGENNIIIAVDPNFTDAFSSIHEYVLNG
mgnify:CR=1 FL=1